MASTEDLGGCTLDVLSPEEVKAQMDKQEIVLIDVRTPAEYAFEHINGAMLFPMSSFDAKNLPGQQEKRIVFHCGSGIRSKKIAERCAAAGYDRIAHMEGGFGAWKEKKLPYIGTDMASGAPKRVEP
jgi:rhodanese-related sulfurtransferase